MVGKVEEKRVGHLLVVCVVFVVGGGWGKKVSI